MASNTLKREQYLVDVHTAPIQKLHAPCNLGLWHQEASYSCFQGWEALQSDLDD